MDDLPRSLFTLTRLETGFFLAHQILSWILRLETPFSCLRTKNNTEKVRESERGDEGGGVFREVRVHEPERGVMGQGRGKSSCLAPWCHSGSWL